MIIYSKSFNAYSNNFLIKILRNNKWFWDYKFFFDHLSSKQLLILAKSLLIRSNKIVFVQLEGLSHKWFYYKPKNLADFNFSFTKNEKTIYWNVFFDEVGLGPIYDLKYNTKTISDLIPKVNFVSANYKKISYIKKNYPDLYKELDIYGEFHTPIGKHSDFAEGRNTRSLPVTARYMASLSIENNMEEGYAQCVPLWSLRAKTPPIFKTQAARKNFIRREFYIDFYDYLKMTKKQRLIEINKVQERLLSGESYLTNLTTDYIEFFQESFSGDNEPDLKKIILKSQAYRSKFLSI